MKKFVFALGFALSLVALTFGLRLILGGSSDMTTHITTLNQLQNMNLNLAEDYILDNDIDASATVGWNGGAGFIPVGTFAAPFTGSFDGQGFTVTGLVINRGGTDYVGLFGVADGVTITNVTLANVNITGKAAVGALVGSVKGNSIISFCHSSGTMVAEIQVGGLIGIAGLVGAPGDLEQITSCDSSASVTTQTVGAKAGGLVGETVYVTISSCFATGAVTDAVAGNSFSTGGLIGVAQSVTISNCYATGNVTGIDYVGGLCGTYRIDSTLSNCHATGDVSGENRIGGLVGSLSDATVSDSYASGDATATADYAGGLVGLSSQGDILRCCANGDVSGVNAVGGLVGWDDRSDVTKCYSLGTVLGTGNNVGGLVGSHSDNTVTISDCFSRSPATGVDRVGGLCGVISGPIQRCFSTGLVNGSGADPGGLIGKQWAGGAVSNSFWDTQTSGQATSDGGIGAPTAEMRKRDIFVDAGWDFNNVWRMCEAPAYVASYPWLRDNDKCESHVCSSLGVLEGGEGAHPPKYRLVIGGRLEDDGIRRGGQVLVCEADRQEVFEMHFTLRQNGGCAEFNLSLKDPDFTVNLGDEVFIHLFGDTNPWYAGRVMERDREGASSLVRKYSGYGHFEQLNAGDLVDKDYGTASSNPTINTISEIVIDILDVYVRPYTSLITDSNFYITDVAGYSVTELHFDKVKPLDALMEVCELARDYELGVDENGNFYFRPISEAITERKWVGKHIASFAPVEDLKKVVNYWYLEGGLLAGGTNYDSVVQDAASILQWERRADKATVPDGFNTLEIARWGNDLLQSTKDPVIRADITGINIEETQTRIWPRGQMRITSEDGKHALDFPIKTVTYHVTSEGITADVELGEKKPSTRDAVRSIEKKLNEEREQLAHDVEQLAAGTAFQPMPLVYLALFKDEEI